ncbi:hypothetical protein [Niveibacterium sp. SC-1]|uniref:hypothetical protein n=1 Tax=Niveibacterium sp. SC-1 TaxID=3135646 RepID=UPI00311D35CA
MSPARQQTEVRTPGSRQHREDAPSLPHERDESETSQPQTTPEQKAQGQQAHADLARGLRDTDRRGGADYQREARKGEADPQHLPHKPHPR